MKILLDRLSPIASVSGFANQNLKLKKVLVGIMLGLGLTALKNPVQAQQDPAYTQYMFNMLPINAAYAGSRDVISLTALYRRQWINVPGAPETVTFSADAPIRKEKLGIGINISNDKIGIFNNTNLMAMLAYRIRFSRSTLSFGVQAGVTQFSANYSSVRTDEFGAANDGAFAQDLRKWLPNIGAGVYYSSDKFYVGVSLPKLLSNQLNEYVPAQSIGDYFKSSQFRHVFFIGGYAFKLNQDLTLKPSFIYKYVLGAPMQLDLNCNLWIYDRFGIGASYRSLTDVSILLELQATNQIRIGYAYDWSHTQLRNYTSGSHEIMLRYEFGYNKSKVISPRYF
ncbi:MAG: type IX secretion system membrane protein PorP/SprF [Cytophagales bacterium]